MSVSKASEGETQSLHDAPERGIDRLASGLWRVRVQLPNGKRLSKTFATVELARSFRDALYAELRSGRWVPEEIAAPKAPPTLKAWGAEWLDRRELAGANRSVHEDRRTWRLHVATAAFAEKSLPEITRLDVLDWMTAMERKSSATDPSKKLSWSRRRQALILLSCALGDAIDRGVITTNVTTGVKVSKPAVSEEPWTFLSLEEIELVKRGPIDDVVRRVFLSAIYTGLRQGELWALTWGDVQLVSKSPVIVVSKSHDGPTKSGKARRVHLIAPALEVLREVKREAKHTKDEDLVFPAKRGGQRHPHDDAGWGPGPEGKARLLREKCGITRRVRFHDLRHTFASHLAMGSWAERWSLHEIAQALGHSSVTVTERYAHLADESLAARAARTVGAVEVPVRASVTKDHVTAVPAPKPTSKKRVGETKTAAEFLRPNDSRGDWIRTSDPQTPSATESPAISGTSEDGDHGVTVQDLKSGALALLTDIAAKRDYGASLASLVANLLALDPGDEIALEALLVDETQARRAVSLASSVIRRWKDH